MGVNSRYKDSVFSFRPVNNMVYPGMRIGWTTETGRSYAQDMERRAVVI
jgi:hypothetical protein